MAYGDEPMKTITVRLSESEIARIDDLAAGLTEVDAGTGWWKSKKGRGDVVRLALAVLDKEASGSDELFASTRKAGVYERPEPTAERVAGLKEQPAVKKPKAKAGKQIPGQQAIS